LDLFTQKLRLLRPTFQKPKAVKKTADVKLVFTATRYGPACILKVPPPVMFSSVSSSLRHYRAHPLSPMEGGTATDALHH
jgi:hypothetical protein